MGFIEAYKRLEKLCGEILNDGRRVSAYIEEMTNTSRGAYFVRGWNDDLKQLKHYRWVRNQIVHDPSCSEENMCNDDDTQWILDFYARIMNQTDPLALYRKATLPQQKPTTKNVEYGQRWDQNHNYNHKKANHSGCLITLLIVVAITIAVLWLLVKTILFSISPFI